jgi:hypothetical protein
LFITSIDLHSFVTANNLQLLLLWLHESFGFHVRIRIDHFESWRICLLGLFFTSIDLSPLIARNDFEILFRRLREPFGRDFRKRISAVESWRVSVLDLFMTDKAAKAALTPTSSPVGRDDGRRPV